MSDLSGYAVDEIKYDPEIHIMAFAGAYVALMNQFQISSKQPVEDHIPVLKEIGNLPDDRKESKLPMEIYLYTTLSFLNDGKYQSRFCFPQYSIDLKTVFGESNYKILSSNYLTVFGPNESNSYGVKSSISSPECSQCVYPMTIDMEPQGHLSRLQRGLTNPRDNTAITHI
ncbi:MAG: hypothetical protein ACRD5H_15655, partial [Nitrososphaerales archaeon]